MQVWARGPAGLTDVADELALRHMRPPLDARRKARQVGVDGRIGFPVLEHHDIAVTALLPGDDHLARAGCMHRRSFRRGEVDTLVCAPVLQERMQARHGKSGGHARDGDW